MPRIALIKVTEYYSNWDEDYEITRLIEGWTEVTQEELNVLEKWVNKSEYRIIQECSEEVVGLTIKKCLKLAEEDRLKGEEQARKNKEKYEKAQRTKQYNSLEKKRKLLEQLKKELGEDD